jgi:hypothetical protein
VDPSANLTQRRRQLIRTLSTAILVSGVLAAVQVGAAVVTGSVASSAITVDRFIDLLVHIGAVSLGLAGFFTQSNANSTGASRSTLLMRLFAINFSCQVSLSQFQHTDRPEVRVR